MNAWCEIRDALVAKKFQPAAVSKDDCYLGTLAIGKIDVQISISIPDYDFIHLPVITVLNREKLPKVLRGHTVEDGTLCYADKATFLLDRFQPAASVFAVLKQVEKTLHVLLHGNPTPEILAELPAYWGGMPYVFIDDPRAMAKVTLATVRSHKKFSQKIAGKNEGRIKKWAINAQVTCDVQSVFEVVQCDNDIELSDKNVSTFGEALDWASSQVGVSSEIERLAKRAFPMPPGLFLVGNNAIVGFEAEPDSYVSAAIQGGFRPQARDQLWFNRKANLKILKFRGINAHHNELTARNLNCDSPLSDKKIALIGCGTLGGYLARNLVQCGAGQGERLLLVDPDVFSPGNIGRHSLGFRFIGRNKADAVAEALLQDSPDVLVEAVARNANELWSRFAGYDLIIDATGDEQFSNALNAQAVQRRGTDQKYPTILYGMIFGNGVAAQTFVDCGNDQSPCYKCLKPDFSSTWRFSPVKKEFEQPEFAIRPCGEGTFAPFAVHATLIAVALMVDHVLDIVSDRENPTLRTRIIDSKKGAGATNKTITVSKNCPACQGQMIGDSKRDTVSPRD